MSRWYHVGTTRTNCRATASAWAKRNRGSAIVRVCDDEGALIESWIWQNGKWRTIDNTGPLAESETT